MQNSANELVANPLSRGDRAVLSPSKLRGDIDGLRAISILAVVAFHAGVPFVGGGFIGVDVFFVISGYLITAHLLREWDTKGRIDLPAFWARRVRRLLPAFAVVVFVILIAAPIVLVRTSGETGLLARAAVAALFLNANHFFMIGAGDYFGAVAETNPLLHMWSLSVEEQYYLIWPIMAVLLLPRIKMRAVWISALTIGSFSISLMMSYVAPTAAFFTMPSRAWEMLGGAVLAALPLRSYSWSARSASVVALAGVLLILAGSIFTRGTQWFPAPLALVPVIGAMLVIAAGTINSDGAASKLLGTPVLSYLGRISYPWYLWHWPLLVFARSARLYEESALIDALMVGVSFVLAVLTYEFVEKPIHQGFLGRGGPRRTFIAGFPIIFFAAGMALLLGAWTRFGWGYSQKELALDAIRRDLPTHDCLWEGVIGMKTIRESKCNFVTGFDDSPHVLLLGDSHANHWRPALSAAAEAQGTGLGVLTMNRCTPLPGSYKDPDCVSFNSNIRSYLHELADKSKINGVILSARWPELTGSLVPSIADQSQHVKDWYIDLSANSDEENLIRLEENLDDLLQELSVMGIRTLIIEPSPVLKFAAPHCLALLNESECGISLRETMLYARDAERIISSVAKKYSNVRLIDPKSFMCSNGFCPAVINGVSVYSDDDHVTKTFSSESADNFKSAIAWLLAPVQVSEMRGAK